MHTSRFFHIHHEAADSSSGSGSGTPASPAGGSAPPAFNPFSDSGPATSPTVNAPAGESRSASTTPDSGIPSERGAEGVAPKAQPVAPSSVPAQTTPPAGTPPAQSPAAQQLMTPEQMAQIATAAAKGVIGAQTQPQNTQPTQPTQEDFDRTFNVAKVDAGVFQAITGYAPDKPEQVAALHNFGQAIARQAVTMAVFQIEQAKREVQGMVTPIADMHRTQLDNSMKNEFFQSYPHLNDFQPLMQEVIKTVQREGHKFDDKASLYKFVADRAHALLGKAVQPTAATAVQPNNSQGAPAPVVGSTRQMTPTSMGGQISATSGSATRSRSDAQTIFG